MSKKSWYTLWGVLYILCAALGFVTGVEGALNVLLILLALAFFVPPAMLLYAAGKNGDIRGVKRIRNLSCLSLLGTLVLMVLNILTAVEGSESLGNAMHALLVMVSSPMYCARNGLVSLFLWACLLMVSIKLLREKK